MRLVVWLNEFFGPIVNAQGKTFEEMPVYSDNKDRIFALVRLPMVSEEASTDLRDMIARRLTFDQALAREQHQHPARPEVTALQVQGGDLAGDRAGDLMEPARLRKLLRKQGIYVHESDPVLEVAAICELAVADTVKAIEGLNKAAADRISAASNQHIEAARQSAAALVTEAGKWSAEQLRETAAEISASILKDLRPEALKAEAAARVAVRMAWLTGFYWRHRAGRAHRVSACRSRARVTASPAAASASPIPERAVHRGGHGHEGRHHERSPRHPERLQQIGQLSGCCDCLEGAVRAGAG